MPAYAIYFRCNECKNEHPLHLRIHLHIGPDHKDTLAAFLLRHSMPTRLMTIRGRKVFCLKTDKKFELENADQIFLPPFTANFIPDERQYPDPQKRKYSVETLIPIRAIPEPRGSILSCFRHAPKTYVLGGKRFLLSPQRSN
jgi:hypothetical protein